jgi:hydroxymethylpyrimidine pyrophosphatase-like HAD family hydrolase
VEDEQEAPGFGLSRRTGAVLSCPLLAVDLDGTLVGNGGHINPADREAIAALARKGIATTIITGRLFSGTREIAMDIGALGAIGCVDGCHLVDVGTAEEFHHGGVAGDAAQKLRAIVARLRPMTFVFARDEILYDEMGSALLRYLRTWSKNNVLVADVAEDPRWSDPRGITGLVSIGTEKLVSCLRDEIDAIVGGSACTTVFPVGATGHWGAVVRASGHSKGTALTWLANHYGTRVSDVIAVGDWYNDIAMFEVAGRSFAMAQAPECVKRAASDCLLSDAQSGGGIAEAAGRAGWL